jgi:L-lactate dehydrogenase complex protein LldG
MSDARAEILARIRSTKRPAAAPVERSYRRRGALSANARVSLFHERVSDYRAEVHRIGESGTGAAIASICAGRGAGRLAVPGGLPAAWRPARVELVDGTALDAPGLDAVDGAITGCTLAIAETGTIVLTAGEAEGPRALTLVPDLHVCVVREGQVVELVPEAIARLQDPVARERRPVTFVSGPSATSDIELSRVEGVHGPRNLVVLIVKETE